MSKKTTVALGVALALVLAGSFTSLEAQSVKSGPNPAMEPGVPFVGPGGGGGASRPAALGTIIYDDGIVTHVPIFPGFTFGNQFDTSNGDPVLSFGSVTRMSYFLIDGAGPDGVFVTVFGPVNGTTASVLTSVFTTPNNGSGTFNTATLGTVVYPGASFLAGVWYVSGDTIGLGTGTVNGQGHHLFVINDIEGTGFRTADLNALVGASGNVVIPVELMGFEIE